MTMGTLGQTGRTPSSELKSQSLWFEVPTLAKNARACPERSRSGGAAAVGVRQGKTNIRIGQPAGQLLIAERDHRIDTRRPPRWDPARDCCSHG
jgi:hypothetical protein